MIVYLNDFEVNTPTNNFWLDEDITGLSMPGIRTSSGDYSGQDGGYVGAQFFSMRQIAMNGRCFSGDVTELEAKRRAIQLALLSKDVTLRIITNAGNDYVMQCKLLRFDMPIKRAIVQAPFKIELLASDPVIYDNNTVLTVALSRAVGGGYTFPIVYPVVWAAGSQPTNIENTGTVTIYPIITIAGTATNPRITNLTTGKFFRVNDITLGSGDTLVIDMKKKNRTVLLNGGNILYKVTDDSDWLSLEIGDNNMLYETDSSGDTANAVISWQAGCIGI